MSFIGCTLWTMYSWSPLTLISTWSFSNLRTSPCFYFSAASISFHTSMYLLFIFFSIYTIFWSSGTYSKSRSCPFFNSASSILALCLTDYLITSFCAWITSWPNSFSKSTFSYWSSFASSLFCFAPSSYFSAYSSYRLYLISCSICINSNSSFRAFSIIC